MVFVTGGTGLIGSFLLQSLASGNMPIKALYRDPVPENLRYLSNIEWVKGDILDTDLMREIIRDAREVYHCAGLVSYAPQDANLLKEINVTGTANIVDACLENSGVKLCHVSSVAAIGWEKGKAIFSENTKWDASLTHSVYANSKYFGELEVWRGVAEGLKAVIVNPSVVLGPSTDWSRSSTQLFKYVFQDRSFYTKGSANFVDVRDVVATMTRLMQADVTGERFIINAHMATYKAFFNEVATCLNRKGPSMKVPNILTEIVWRAELVRSLITGKRPLITKDTARLAKKKHKYSNEKIKNYLNLEFRPLSETITWCCRELLAQRGKIQIS